VFSRGSRELTGASMITGLHDRVLFRIAAAAGMASLLALTAPFAQGAARQGSGRIEGQVTLVMPPAGAVPSGVYPSRRVSRPVPKAAEISNVVVFLKDAVRQNDLRLTPATITQRDEAFVPRVVAITRGSTVDFPNSDPFFHNVFSLSRGASFDLGRYPKGVTKSRRFSTAGLVKVFCHIHSHMTASIMVFDHPYFRIPGADGTFVIDDVPVGTHQIAAWHERIGESATSIHVEGGRTTRSEFALPMDSR
jgi:plastocyanin